MTQAAAHWAKNWREMVQQTVSHTNFHHANTNSTITDKQRI